MVAAEHVQEAVERQHVELLHVMGYDHETDDGTMDRLEGRLRRLLLGFA